MTPAMPCSVRLLTGSEAIYALAISAAVGAAMSLLFASRISAKPRTRQWQLKNYYWYCQRNTKSATAKSMQRRVSVSRCTPESGLTAEKMIKAADIAMFDAKKRGGGRFQYYATSLNTKLERRLR